MGEVMAEDLQRQLDTRAIEIAAEGRGSIEAMRNLFTAMMARIDSNELWQRNHQVECHAERKEAREAREKLREDTQRSLSKIHGRLNAGLVLLVLTLIGIVGALIRPKLGL